MEKRILLTVALLWVGLTPASGAPSQGEVAEWDISPYAGICAMAGARPVGYLIRIKSQQ
jgi:hypothetical protein